MDRDHRRAVTTRTRRVVLTDAPDVPDAPTAAPPGPEASTARDAREVRAGSATALAAKRALDVLVAATVLLLLLPFVLVLMLAIVLESPGSPIFVQSRVGRGGRPFPLLKFRTMVPDADVMLVQVLDREPELAAQWARLRKLPRDPRVTRLGHVLRRMSLDELPQLVNVLRGDMSLVGPRPVLDEEIPLFGSAAHVILRMRPGLTGLWAVSGRSNVDYGERAQLERRYVEGWSLWRDLGILVRTIPAIVRTDGAY